MRNMENPFKFGTIVEENYFTDRVEEVAYIESSWKVPTIWYWLVRVEWTGDGEVPPKV